MFRILSWYWLVLVLLRLAAVMLTESPTLHAPFAGMTPVRIESGATPHPENVPFFAAWIPVAGMLWLFPSLIATAGVAKYRFIATRVRVEASCHVVVMLRTCVVAVTVSNVNAAGTPLTV